MLQKSKTTIVLTSVVLMVFVIVFSLISVRLWGGKPEELPQDRELTLQDTMTIQEFGKSNRLPNEVLQKVCALASKEDLQKTIRDVGLSHEEITSKVKKAAALEAEHESKNWLKIVIKFAVWIGFLIYVFFLLKNGRISPNMNAILKQEQTIPDCFACGSCIDVCPVNAVHVQSGKRNATPAGKFEK